MTKKRIVIEVTDKQHDLVSKAAKKSGKTIKAFLMQEIILQIKNVWIVCPSCKEPLIDLRMLNIAGGPLHLKCDECGHNFDHPLGQDDYDPIS